MKKSILSLVAFAAIVSATLVSCAGSEKKAEGTTDSTAMMTDTMAKEEGVMVGGALMVPSKDIVDNAVGSADHTTLVAAVKAGELVETLKTAGPFTVFAPTNEAFAAIQSTVDKLLKPEAKKDLVGVLTYHVVAGALTADSLTDGRILKTVNGAELKVSNKEGKVFINDAEVTIADVISSNGVTHVINKVLVPAAKK